MCQHNVGFEFYGAILGPRIVVQERQFQDLTRFRLPQGYRGRAAWFVQLWWVFEALFVRSTPQAFYSWRRLALRLFGAKIGRNVMVRPGVRVTFPWKLEIADHCWIGDNVTLYSVARITIGAHTAISPEAYLCAGTHDHRDISFPLITGPIIVEPECWIAARAFVGPGVTVGRGAVVGACSLVLSHVPSATVVGGVPASKVGKRISSSPSESR
jgi:putative colanic acid biosynthesis acetyltransferase WcaF